MGAALVTLGGCFFRFKEPSLGGRAGVASLTCNLSVEDLRLPAGLGGSSGG